jgi:hypothetical protein
MTTNLHNITEVFKEMQSNDFDTNSPLKWGFYFVDPNKEKLETLFEELKDNNYILEDIYLSEENDKEWTLHVSKIEILTPDKLHKRNNAFNELAEYCEVALYDGWDVEKINQ